MRDIDVRIALIGDVCANFAGDPGTLVLEELNVGDSRIDLAVINGALHGYEIKSESDTLQRLTPQVESYNSIFDQMTLVVGRRHLDAVISQVPCWWGIMEATQRKDGRVTLREIRATCLNPSQDPVSIAWLLWSNEARSALETIGCSRIKSKTRSQLAEMLASRLSLSDLKALVRTRLRERVGWRSGAVRM